MHDMSIEELKSYIISAYAPNRVEIRPRPRNTVTPPYTGIALYVCFMEGPERASDWCDTEQEIYESAYQSIQKGTYAKPPNARLAELFHIPAPLAEPKPSWRCFHCDEVFTDRQAAEDHFGGQLYEGEVPACVEILSEGEKAIIEDRRLWRTRALTAERENENLEFQVGSLTDDLRSRFKGATSINQVWNQFDSLEGRVLAAEEQKAALEARLTNSEEQNVTNDTYIHLLSIKLVEVIQALGITRGDMPLTMPLTGPEIVHIANAAIEEVIRLKGPDLTDKYYIVCTRHKWDGKVNFWGPGRGGYCTWVDKAGLYSEEEARQITLPYKADFMVPASIVRTLGHTVIELDEHIAFLREHAVTE